jgi:outer membrane protein TolC
MRPWRDSSARLVAAATLTVVVLSPLPATAANLASVLEEVAARNPAVAASAARADAASSGARRSGAWEPTMFEFGVVNVPTSLRFDEDPMTMKTIGVRQRISPRSSREGRAGAEAATAAAQDLRLARQEALGAAVESYVAAWSSGERVAAAERHLSLLGRAVDAARSRYAAGTGGMDDVLRMRSEEARTRASLAALRAEQRAGRLRLSILRGLAPEFEGEPLEPPVLAPVPETATAWLEAVDETNPRLRAADAEVARYRFAAGAARAGNWPMLELMYEYGFREDLAMSTGMGTSQDDMFSARVGLSVPLFGRSEPAQMEAMARAAESEKLMANLELLEAVAMSHEEARAGTATARLLADTVLVAGRAALEAAWSAYAAGSVDLVRVLDVAHALFFDELELTRAREQAMAAQGRAFALLGRGELIGIAVPEPAPNGSQPKGSQP